LYFNKVVKCGGSLGKIQFKPTQRHQTTRWQIEQFDKPTKLAQPSWHNCGDAVEMRLNF
jgi:hypothetical protein